MPDVNQLPSAVAELESAFVAMNSSEAEKILKKSMDRFGLLKMTDSLLAPALEKIGEAWQKGELSLAQVYMSGRIAEKITLKFTNSIKSQHSGHYRLGMTVFEDFHTLGKTIVLSILCAGGYPVIDLGQGRTIDELVSETAERNLDALFVSVLMHRSALRIENLVAALRSAGLKTRLVVGGAPFLFDRLLWTRVGADEMGANASDALGIAARLSGKGSSQ